MVVIEFIKPYKRSSLSKLRKWAFAI